MKNSDILMEAGWNIIDGWWCNPKLNDTRVFECDSVDLHERKRFLDIMTKEAYLTGARRTADNAKEVLIQAVESISVYDIINNM